MAHAPQPIDTKSVETCCEAKTLRCLQKPTEQARSFTELRVLKPPNSVGLGCPRNQAISNWAWESENPSGSCCWECKTRHPGEGSLTPARLIEPWRGSIKIKLENYFQSSCPTCPGRHAEQPPLMPTLFPASPPGHHVEQQPFMPTFFLTASAFSQTSSRHCLHKHHAEQLPFMPEFLPTLPSSTSNN